MRYREGDKVTIIDQSSPYFLKPGTVLPVFTDDETNNEIWVAFAPNLSTGYRFTTDQVKLKRSSIRGQEVAPVSCCVSSSGNESARVLLEECPIKRTVGQHETTLGMRSTKKVRVCTCIDIYCGISKCDYFKRLDQVTRGGRKVWRVSCDAVKN